MIKFFDIKFHNLDIDILDNQIWFVIIVCEYKWKWVYVKHKDRTTWELPWWHKENWESMIEWAKRELFEETWVIDFDIEQIGFYSLKDIQWCTHFGGVFFAKIYSFWNLPESEIKEVQFFDSIPNNLTYPELHYIIHNKAKNIVKNNFISINSSLVYDEKTDKFSKFLIPNPLSICYKIIKKCNFNCPHCIASSWINESYGLNTEDAKKVIQNIAKSWIKRLDITWWEPFLRNDINEILQLAYGLWLELVITTNGAILKNEHLELLSRLNIFTQVSIDWPKDINDKLRVKWSFDIAINALNKLNSYNIPTNKLYYSER
jgi:8-oxo-dGTP diphosphatase